MAAFDRPREQIGCRAAPKATSIACAAFLVFVAIATNTTAEDPDGAVPTLERLEPWTTIFADSDVLSPVRIHAAEPFRGRLIWGLVADGNVPLARGEKHVNLAADEEFDVAIPLKFPALKPGATLSAQLAFQLLATNETAHVASLEETIIVFTDDPFVDRRQWLSAQDLHLYDPAGRTVALFSKLDWPFEELANLAAINELTEGVLVIGEGVSLREERGLAEAMLQLASRGVAVICLAPTDGAVSLPTQPDADAPSVSLLLQNASAIRRLDKRLDSRQWMSHRLQPQSTVTLQPDGSQTVAEFAVGRSGWSWFELQFETPGQDGAASRCIICGYPLIERWDDGPTPRFLLARLLEYVSPTVPSTSP